MNSENTALTTDRDRLQERVAELEKDLSRHERADLVAYRVKCEKAEAEVARLTAVMQGELAEAWKQGCLAVCNGGIDECGHSEPHMHPALNPYLAGGTDTPKDADTEGDA